MSERLLDYDALTGVSTYHEYDGASGKTLIHTYQDIEPYLERNKAAYNTPGAKERGIRGCWWQVADIPLVVLLKWKYELGVDWNNRNHLPKIRALLNSSEYRYLRTSPGRI